jgi:hypothetical protein
MIHMQLPGMRTVQSNEDVQQQEAKHQEKMISFEVCAARKLTTGDCYKHRIAELVRTRTK